MLEINTIFSVDRRMTLTQEIELRDVLIPLECVIHLNSELKISQSSQTTSLVHAFRKDKLDKYVFFVNH